MITGFAAPVLVISATAQDAATDPATEPAGKLAGSGAGPLTASELNLIEACPQTLEFYCLSEMEPARSKVVISYTGIDAQGRLRGCSPQGSPWTREHHIACAFNHHYRRYAPNDPVDFVFSWSMDFAALGDLAETPRPAIAPQLRLRGYNIVLHQGTSSEEVCTDLACLWTYPPRAIRREETGDVFALVLVNDQGRGVDCAILIGVSETLDRTTCERLTAPYVRYEPARNPQGEPRAAVLISAMAYRLN